ncbi:DNA replication and repair protein RecF [Cellulosimicrobium cellulans]|jgi:DNA replication and repair protein RecF|uniref:DNA replication/repair protein RecF n=1 Tax=Cellulosimicrobium cellulans TaxID=1710 RepID=UPI00195DCC7F|nr:DNA replication/repair protein RecF [Cellulosimicrobium cellulans]MBM7817816.1 DNA replication and repair protein RecF [Cellulosimicrobium cellulans]
MYVSHLSLVDFRSYESVDVELVPGVNALVGPNGQGKTNLVEAIGYVATLASHRVAGDAALVRAGATRAVVRTRVVRGDRASTVELEIASGRANRARINRSPAKRPRDVLGIVRTVLFAPEDLALVKGDPDGRRRFLDQLAVLLVPRVAALLADYERVLRQRGALLKSATALRGRRATRRTRAAEPPPDDDAAEGTSSPLATLEVWDARLASLGAEITALRLQLVAALTPYVAEAYEQVSAGQGEAQIAYRSSVDEALDPDGAADGVPPRGEPGTDGDGPTSGLPDAPTLEKRMLDAMRAVRAKEIERGVNLVGPHRDDVVLTLGGLPAKGYASHGESWSFALALRLASYRLLKDGAPAGLDSLLWADQWGPDGEPVLVLDDVFAELDVRRRERLAELVAGAGQVIITAAVPDDVPALLDGARFAVHDGTVSRVED